MENIVNFVSKYYINKEHYYFFAVILKGGLQPYEGNVFATNPTTGIFGPICDDFWSMKDVIILKNTFQFSLKILQATLNFKFYIF